MWPGYCTVTRKSGNDQFVATGNREHRFNSRDWNYALISRHDGDRKHWLNGNNDGSWHRICGDATRHATGYPASHATSYAKADRCLHLQV
jgi:diaminopimelate epimerase